PTTNISFSLPESGKVSLRVYNVLGQEVRTLVDEYLDAGVHTIQFDASNLSSGMYFYRLNTESFTESKKMMLVK
ncbi:MAG: T9SS type A sorting domain-containing protein, partial [candidate division Zixibacteria bacterium]|nr:T9SS type A sorting domain-containing protein [candidate division Zixibacteria bacterium]NIT54187.1 T9SS type A sorting domain-containing protein [candidate division Zixibacteria bacterium]NIW42692.1 T9SS type A sorting domain-containing protein [candidate division Zixibacteria bacterium]NIX57053.1 T9SS type A sorting domain-containing protein [candidate division Zixibacteria bacterium]